MTKPKRAEEPKDAVDGWVTRSVRFPEDVLKRVTKDAKKNRRSAQHHIIWLIEKALEQQEGSSASG